MTGHRRPRLLFIPTASDDSDRYCGHVERYFGRHLRCDVSVLRLIGERPTAQARRDAIASADAIYVGGGNTLRMMRLWRHLGVDSLLRAAYARAQ
jgi:dipeptidase E